MSTQTLQLCFAFLAGILFYDYLLLAGYYLRMNGFQWPRFKKPRWYIKWQEKRLYEAFLRQKQAKREKEWKEELEIRRRSLALASATQQYIRDLYKTNY